MKRTYASQVAAAAGQEVILEGWVQTRRNQGSIVFLVLRDVTGTVQCVASKGMGNDFEACKEISVESVVRIHGLAKAMPQAPGGVEVEAASFEILSHAEPELPIPVVEKGEGETEQSTRLDWRWLDLRKPEKLLTFKAWTLLEESFRDYWKKNGFLELHSPKLMSVPSESGADLFEVKYFDRKAYLSQSPQFYKQMAMAAGFEKVFEVGPVFRAEPSFTSRHATEFTGFDMEFSFIESHEDVMKVLEEIISQSLAAIKETYGEEIKERFGREVIVPSLPFPRITMKEAKALLKPLGIESEKEGDLNPEEEKQLSRLIKEKHGHEFVFVTEYPIDVRPFYHMRKEEDPTLTKSFDLMWNGVEITTGAQREHRYDILTKQALEKGLTLESIQFYLNFFRYGCPPHGGCGIGPTRMMMKLIDADNIREVTFLHRGVNRLTP